MKNLYNWSTFLVLTFLFLNANTAFSQSLQYLHLDGEDDFVEVAEASQYVAGAEAVSMAGWFYTDELVYGQGMMGFRGGGTGDGEMYLIQLNSGTVECRYINGAGFYEFVGPNFTILPEVWQHVAWVYDGTKVELFINGNSVGSSPAAGTIDSVNKPFAIGKSIQGGFNFVFGGSVDEVTLWSKALTSADLQDIMENELVGDEANLELYYKCNQGVPAGDNTTITELVSEVGAPERNGTLVNFALTGETSNFLGELDDSFQAIAFPAIPNKLISDAPFLLEGEASSGLEVSYSIVSGPASVSGNEVTLDGTAGAVTVRASQAGDAQYSAALDVETTFQVLDPNTFVPEIDVRNPLAGDVFVPELGAIQLAAISSIGYPELFNVATVTFEINGEMIAATDYQNDHYTAWWTPSAYGDYAMNIISENNYGASSTATVNFSVVNTATNTVANAGQEVWLNSSIGAVEVEAELPSYMGAYDVIMGNLDITCPDGGCDPWDRISGVEVKGHNGQWYEIIRYITPYGVACSSSIDLTDFMSILHGKVTFRYYLGTFGNGFNYTLDLDYNAGTPDYKYSTITKLWNETFPFGDFANLQPVPDVNVNYPDNIEASKIKLVSSGHGWGENNTGNAAEFHNDTHHVHIDDVQTFAQHNWLDCDPNPDGCNPQNGTWYFDRAGWCPGAIAPWFDFDMTPYVGNGSVQIGYKFNQSYIDSCHPSNPNCISSITCPNCNDGFNPHLIVASYLISLGNVPLGLVTTGTDELVEQKAKFDIFPNPSTGRFTVELEEQVEIEAIRILNNLGQNVKYLNLNTNSNKVEVDLAGIAKGIYFVEIKTATGNGMQKVIVE